jgi:hypothetical protein
MEILRVSCLTGIGMAGWLNWLRQRRSKQFELKQESVALG